MPLTGTLDITPLLEEAPIVKDLGTGRWELRQAEVLQVLYELDEPNIQELIPPALHPTIPPTISFVFTHVPESEVGRFTLAEARVGCRSGARPRALLVRAYCDSEPAIHELASRWGYPVRRGDVSLSYHYDRVFGRVEVGGAPVLDCALVNPEAIGGGDIQYIANMNLARLARDSQEIGRLIQVDPDYAVHKAERGRPQLDCFDGAAWGLPTARPVYAVSASYTVCDISMPRIRYLVDPLKRPLESVEVVGH
jgi:hypothetical protein